MQRSNVCPAEPLSKDKFQRLLAMGWGRVGPDMGYAQMAAKMGLNETKTISRGVNATNLPEAHTIFNSLCANETALQEILAHYGFDVVRRHSEAANDLHTAACMANATGSFIEALSDGKRDHRETLALADMFRPLLKMLGAVVEEADRIKAGEAA